MAIFTVRVFPQLIDERIELSHHPPIIVHWTSIRATAPNLDDGVKAAVGDESVERRRPNPTVCSLRSTSGHPEPTQLCGADAAGIQQLDDGAVAQPLGTDRLDLLEQVPFVGNGQLSNSVSSRAVKILVCCTFFRCSR